MEVYLHREQFNLMFCFMHAIIFCVAGGCCNKECLHVRNNDGLSPVDVAEQNRARAVLTVFADDAIFTCQ